MSVPLQFGTKCAKCGAFMSPGTPVDFVKDGKTYEHWHAEGFNDDGNPMDGCLIAAAQAKQPSNRRRFDLRECSNETCAASAGLGFARGAAPDRCHICGSEWAWEMAA